MSRLAMEVEQAARALRARRDEGRAAPAGRPKEATVAKGRKGKASQDARAGINRKPKSKALFINRAGALALVDRLLAAALGGDLTAEERYEAERLRARIEARG